MKFLMIFLVSDFIENLESKYGVLEPSGDETHLGLESYEISYDDMPDVWEKLVNELKRLNLVIG